MNHIYFTANANGAGLAAALAKGEGRERVYIITFTFFSSEMGNAALEKIKIQNDLHKAIKNDEFVLYYQPIIDISTDSVRGLEALIRWIHPSEGLILPDKFINVAEESGKIIDIGSWVMRNACKFAKEIYDKGHYGFYISVNVSVIQLLQKNFLELLSGVLEETGLSPEYLTIEITESVLMESYEQITK